MKIVRLGNTESHLLFITYVLRHGNEVPYIKQQLTNMLKSFTNWLYTTAGYYDKTVSGNRMNFDNTAFNKNYFEFIKHLEISIGGCEKAQFYMGENMLPLFNKYREDFFKKYNIINYQSMNGTHFYDRIDSVFNYMKNKKVLAISSFDGLIEKQYNTGNVYKIYKNFPEITSLKTIKFPYCFLNNGPDNNYHETLDFIFNKIKEIDFDIALLGCGCYGHMLCHKIDSELNKDAIYLGGSIQTIFGILSSREKEHSNLPWDKNWITDIPQEYKPTNYKMIENGCYW
tara:strand:- start:122 stop:976 length:855 start_codon:yes stop_codon:yes gene_type:complete